MICAKQQAQCLSYMAETHLVNWISFPFLTFSQPYSPLLWYLFLLCCWITHFPLSSSPLSSKGWSGMAGCISLMFQHASVFKEHWMKENCGSVFRLKIKGSWVDWWCLPSTWMCCLLTWLVSMFLPYLVFSDYVSTTRHMCRKPV